MPELTKKYGYIQAAHGCHWTRGEYAISTVQEGSKSGYAVYRNRVCLGTLLSLEHVFVATDRRRTERRAVPGGLNIHTAQGLDVLSFPASPFRIPGRNGTFRGGYVAITRDEVAIYATKAPPTKLREPVPVIAFENTPELRLMLRRLLEGACDAKWRERMPDLWG